MKPRTHGPVLIFFLLLSACFSLAFSQPVTVKILHFPTDFDTLEVPWFESTTRPEVAAQLNQLFQNYYFEETFTPDTFKQTVWDLMCRGEEHMMGWATLRITDLQDTDRYLKIDYDTEYMGAYPNPWKSTFLFDLETGLPVDPESLFTLEGWYDFLNTYWLEDCFAQLPEAHECGGGDPTVEGECYSQCYSFDQFYFGYGTMDFKLAGCFPHALVVCDPHLARTYSTSTLEPYLNPYGKYLLEFSDEKVTEVPAHYFLIGKMDDRIRICMALEVTDEASGRVEGYYYYQKVKQHIPLKGWVKDGRLTLSEYIEGNYNGAFSLEWDNFLYSTEGEWENKAGSKKLKVDLNCTYEYDRRSLLR